MSSRARDRITGAVLLAVALVWITLVFQTIEPGEGAAAGARVFPLFFGLVLALLSLAVLVRAVLGFDAAEEPVAEAVGPSETTSVLATIGCLAGYAFLLEPLGFILSTVVAVAVIMVFLLRIRAPLTIAAMSLGLAIGCYIVFGKLLGTYLPPGTLVSIYF
jgi:putative tricarboxylic transport membrane protein